MTAFKVVVSCLLLSVILAAWFPTAANAASAEETEQYLDQVEQALVSAHSAVAEAEVAGANITFVRNRLAEAAELLASATNAFRRGDFDSALLLATQCNATLGGIVEDASSLRVMADAAFNEKLYWAAAGASIGLSMLFVLSLFGWRYLRRWFLGRVWRLKPELGEG